MFIDLVKIKLKAGDGGDGCKSFFSAKHNNKGGPDGGDGGRGGDIVFRADSQLATLLDFRYNAQFTAENGGKGQPNNRSGKTGAPLVLRVPRGTLIKDLSGRVIADMSDDGAERTVLRGGAGGRGNTRFATSTRQAPNFAQLGVKTARHEVILELKTIADVGLTGFPNAGKSTVLSVISEAKPKIADYPFTTLSPNLGVVGRRGANFVVADIPGIIEGAARGAGLGHEFLRHIERVRLLLHVVDCSGFGETEPFEAYLAVRKELKEYSRTLAKLPEIVVLNKADLRPDADAFAAEFKARLPRNTALCLISAITGRGVNEMLDAASAKLRRLKTRRAVFGDGAELESPPENVFNVRREGDAFVVDGGAAESLSRGVVVSDPESMAWFQRALDKRGVIGELKRQGVKDGDTVRILDIEFEYRI